MPNSTSNTTSTPATSTCKVIDTFPLGKMVCEILAFHLSEATVSGHVMLSRGRESGASMNRAHFQYFWNNRKDIPDRHSNKHFGFPESRFAENVMRFIERRSIPKFYIDEEQLYYDWNCNQFRLSEELNNSWVLIRLSLPAK